MDARGKRRAVSEARTTAGDPGTPPSLMGRAPLPVRGLRGDV